MMLDVHCQSMGAGKGRLHPFGVSGECEGRRASGTANQHPSKDCAIRGA